MAAMRLSALLAGLAKVGDDADCIVSGLCDDSRNLVSGQVFFAYPGVHSDGRDYIGAALEAGAAAVIYEADNFVIPAIESSIPLIAVTSLSANLGRIAARFYANPSAEMNIYAVTGTNGKTSVSHFLAQALVGNRPVGVIGTLGNGLWGGLASSPLTTPSALGLQKMLRQMLEDGVKNVVMEASSHGLAQNRLVATQVDTAIFTNLTQDHLDYHKTMAKYGAAKRRLFEIEGLKHAVINVYDAYGAELAASLPANIELVSYGLQNEAACQVNVEPMVKGVLCQSNTAGIVLDITTPYGPAKLESAIMGHFNAENLLAVLAAMLANDIALDEAVERLSHVQPVAGRMERFGGSALPLVFVDYAHTPAALQSALVSLRQFCQGKLHVVFGCGGNRDKDKRAKMGEVAQRFADELVITDDNPRHESPEAIIADILAGANDSAKVRVERDRENAILSTLKRAKKEDIVLIAGKGHEDYQLVGDQRLPFSDRALVKDFMARAA